VRADDQDGSGLAKSFNIRVVDLSASVGSQSAQLVEANVSSGISSATIAITKANVDGTASFDTIDLVNNGWNLSSGNVYIKAGTYGSASFDISSGIISYSLENNATATQALTEGQAATDAFGSILAISGYDIARSDLIAFAITGGNDAPTVTSPSFVYFADNSTDTAYIVSGTDPESSKLSYAISGGADAALFAIDSITGAISFITAPDYEAPSDANADNIYVINVVTIDGALSGADRTVRIIVANENEAPTAVTLANTIPSLPENTIRSSAIKVADIIISDDVLGINTISLSGADAAAFDVVESVLFLKADTTFDF
jgi:VCBS repeat-containing protein